MLLLSVTENVLGFCGCSGGSATCLRPRRVLLLILTEMKLRDELGVSGR